MSAEAFVDTNILIYAACGAIDFPEKYNQAWGVIGKGKYAISSQVMAEFYVNATKKKKDTIAEPLAPEEAATWIDRLSLLTVVPVDHRLVKAGVVLSMKYKIKYWDAALIAAAELIEMPILYTEDLNHGQKYGSVTVINPFRAN
jgi:predicted nucleic acid-binding protein